MTAQRIPPTGFVPVCYGSNTLGPAPRSVCGTHFGDRVIAAEDGQSGGVGGYWIADPGQPSVTMIRWNDGDVQEQTVVGADTVEAPWPFPTRVNPQMLVEDASVHGRMLGPFRATPPRHPRPAARRGGR